MFGQQCPYLMNRDEREATDKGEEKNDKKPHGSDVDDPIPYCWGKHIP